MFMVHLTQETSLNRLFYQCTVSIYITKVQSTYICPKGNSDIQLFDK